MVWSGARRIVSAWKGVVPVVVTSRAAALDSDATMMPSLLRFAIAVCSLPWVRALRLSSSAHRLDFWELLDHDDPTVEDEVFRLEQEHLDVPTDIDIDVHAVP